ncbi:hypothetical protein OEZ49_20155 [Ruegeria sp. WL0004]|uniref:DUF4169 family protein n=1 Tax=Ruegeria marisflavi TaxID=2984152 RepID=A0ABT2WWP4_9RHOB|nr:hypothetical protein [Ruegeria sp. WL0004]MCU9840083.1 hypothetical protein [Ruegeria sp. WL0004]
MAEEKSHPKAKRGKETREDRLKAALKANLARRKAQARARSSSEEEKAEDTD